MRRFVLSTGLWMALLSIGTGCTDFVEPNQLAFVLGTAVDQADDGMIEISHQIVIPSQKSGAFGGSSSEASKNFVVMSGKGNDVFEASQNIQRKMTRKLLTSHRILIVMSEEFVQKNNARKLFDKLNRDPANNQRDLTLLVKGSSAKDFLMLEHPMEQMSSIASGKEMKINGFKQFSTRQFMIDSLAEGVRPILPVIEIEQMKMRGKKASPFAAVGGFVTLDKQLKIVGRLNQSEGANAIWLAGKGTFNGVTIPWEEGGGYMSFRVTHLHRRFELPTGEKKLDRIVVTVGAQAYLLENTTPLDMSDQRNVMIAQRHLNEHIQRDLMTTVKEVQRSGSDVFGIGEYLHRKAPYRWKSMKQDWDDGFKRLDIVVQAKIRIKSVGASGKSYN